MLGVWIIEQLVAERDAALDALSDDELKALWDACPDDPDDIWRALNRRGRGDLCMI